MENTLTFASSYLTQFHTDKKEIEAFASSVINEVKSGSKNPLSIKIFCKSISKALEEIEKGIADDVLIEAEKYGAKKFSVHGCQVEMAELGTKYDYAGCNDSKWNELDKQIKALTEKKKEREKFLQALRESVADTETGEIITPPVKSSTSGIKISIK